MRVMRVIEPMELVFGRDVGFGGTQVDSHARVDHVADRNVSLLQERQKRFFQETAHLSPSDCFYSIL